MLGASSSNAAERSGSYLQIGFNGQLHEPGSSWQLLGNGYRAYNPVLMRFHNPDSLSPFDQGGLNSYAYCKGDPRNRVDPSGHSPLLIMLGGMVLGATGIAVATKTSGKVQAVAIGAALLGVAAIGGGLAWGIDGVAKRGRAAHLWREIKTLWKNRNVATPRATAGNQRPSIGSPPSRPSSAFSARSSRSSSTSSGSGKSELFQPQTLEHLSMKKAVQRTPGEEPYNYFMRVTALLDARPYLNHARERNRQYFLLNGLPKQYRTTTSLSVTQNQIRQGRTGP